MDVDGEGDTAFAASAGGEPQGKIDMSAVPEEPILKAGPAAKRAEAPAAPGAGSIQLGAFSSEAAANTAWKALAKRFAYLEPLTHSVVEVKSGDKTLYRLRPAVRTPPISAVGSRSPASSAWLWTEPCRRRSMALRGERSLPTSGTSCAIRIRWDIACSGRNCASPGAGACADREPSLAAWSRRPGDHDRPGRRRVSRMQPPVWPAFPPAGTFGELYRVAPMSAIEGHSPQRPGDWPSFSGNAE
jgi:hypothetical protein